MNRKDELYYENIGENFDKFMSDFDVDQRAKLVLEMLDGVLSSNALEVGCGTGAITSRYRNRVSKLLVTDISEKLAINTSLKNDCQGAGADATSLPFANGEFDLVVSSECIEHSPDPSLALKEMCRVIAPGGILVLTTPNKLWYPVVKLSQLLKLRNFQGNEIFLSRRNVRKVVEASNFVLLEHTGCHLLPWQIPGIKPILRRIDRHNRFISPLMINQAIKAQKKM
jgi:2-polyprenyl-6-hydroxyphenyl methylase/3-demethylubiquinone-9 3-methyltransferase